MRAAEREWLLAALAEVGDNPRVLARLRGGGLAELARDGALSPTCDREGPSALACWPAREGLGGGVRVGRRGAGGVAGL